MSYSLNTLKGGYIGDYMGDYYGVSQNGRRWRTLGIYWDYENCGGHGSDSVGLLLGTQPCSSMFYSNPVAPQSLGLGFRV